METHAIRDISQSLIRASVRRERDCVAVHFCSPTLSLSGREREGEKEEGERKSEVCV